MEGHPKSHLLSLFLNMSCRVQSAKAHQNRSEGREMAVGKVTEGPGSVPTLDQTLVDFDQAMQVQEDQMVRLMTDPTGATVLTCPSDNSGEEKPSCLNCQRQSETCDYSIRLNWDGRSKKKPEDASSSSFQTISFAPTPSPSSHAERGTTTRHQAADGIVEQDEQARNTPIAVSTKGSNLASESPWSMEQNRSHFISTGIHSASLPQIQALQGSSYPSPAEPRGTHPNTIFRQLHVEGTGTACTTPEQSLFPSGSSAFSPSNVAKRIKLDRQWTDSQWGGLAPPFSGLNRSLSQGFFDGAESSRSTFQTPLPPLLSRQIQSPLTPSGSSSTGADDVRLPGNLRPGVESMGAESDFRRVSVNSLLSTSPEPENFELPSLMRDQFGAEPLSSPKHPRVQHYRHGSTTSDIYGFDRGQHDLDLPKNNDSIAISAVSPLEPAGLEMELSDFDPIPEFAFGLQNAEVAYVEGGYYAQSVPIKIPRSLGRLPPALLENPMNLLYFHHFLNHTARFLVPNDCSENPFKTILPKSRSMATHRI